ncbi:Tn3 family transposase [Streptomyces olivoreticuli]
MPVCSRISNTIRTARSRSSSGYFLFAGIDPNPIRTLQRTQGGSTALRTGMLKALAPVGTREAIDETKFLERLLLIAYAYVYGTNSGISSVAAGEHGHREEELRYTARRYLTAGGLKAAGVEIANTTFAARSEAVWGQGTTTVASDSTDSEVKTFRS